jgi:hypothetical protein
MHLRTFSIEGISYITSSRTSSIAVRSPRAATDPVFGLAG